MLVWQASKAFVQSEVAGATLFNIEKFVNNSNESEKTTSRKSYHPTVSVELLHSAVLKVEHVHWCFRLRGYSCEF